MITIDASVLVAAGAPDDPVGADAAAFIEAVLTDGLAIHQPTLTLVEVGAAIARRTGDIGLASEAGATLLSMPGLIIHPLDLEAAADSAAIAARLRLRGADAIYVATAVRSDAALITLDDELLTRTSPLVDAVTPTEWLERRR